MRAGTPGTPIDIRYETTWPEEVPELRVGETLVKPKNDLPQIDGQSSVEILYEQSLPQSDRSSVRLIDPIRMRTAPLAQLPGTIETRNRAANFYFPLLPPYLEGRVSSPSGGSTVAIGRGICRAARGGVLFVVERANTAGPGHPGGVGHGRCLADRGQHTGGAGGGPDRCAAGFGRF